MLPLLLLPLAQAAPTRLPPEKPAATVWETGRSDARVIVKLAEGTEGTPTLEGATIHPLFPRDPAILRAERKRVDPEGRLADLTLYYVVEVAPGAGPAAADAFNAEPWVEIAYLAFLPQPPPQDIPPTTPDFTGQQGYLGPAPGGFGIDEAARWPGGDGANVAIADLEYGWETGHEDLARVDAATTWGLDTDQYRFHGNGVLGILLAGVNGYGVDGMVPEADPVVIYPYTPEGEYNLPAAINGGVAMLDPGDVLLIEQQIVAEGDYAPVEADPATFDAIALAVAAGVVVVEPAANGGQDLDHNKWEGWFDRGLRDSGAILVGGGASPASPDQDARTWVRYGSCYGARVDVQGWYDFAIASTINGDVPSLADLYYPDGDSAQAYTASFGGTSGASPQVAAVAAIAQSVSIALRGEPFDPLTLRALMVSTGTPQPNDADGEAPAQHIGPQPDLRRLLRVGLLP
ncbi:MAG: S8 family serine peptidase [Alphaproteobacteria bacterium]|nr:S8 family serine peptidase [Alphaproteobacteria bacterium]